MSALDKSRLRRRNTRQDRTSDAANLPSDPQHPGLSVIHREIDDVAGDQLIMVRMRGLSWNHTAALSAIHVSAAIRQLMQRIQPQKDAGS